jgi:hypothetical protein
MGTYSAVINFGFEFDAIALQDLLNMRQDSFEPLFPYSQKIQTIAKPGIIRRQGSLRGCPPLPSVRR